MEKSGGVRPGGGATYPGIPPMGVLRSVLLRRWRSLHIPGSAEQSGSTTWKEPTVRLPYMYSGVLGGSSGDKTLLLWPPLAAGVRQLLGCPSRGTAWAAVPVDPLPCPELGWPILIS